MTTFDWTTTQEYREVQAIIARVRAPWTVRILRKMAVVIAIVVIGR